VLECPPGTNAFGHVEVWAEHAALRGTDRMAPTRMPFRPIRGGGGGGVEDAMRALTLGAPAAAAAAAAAVAL
jgi:hypothetical protein